MGGAGESEATAATATPTAAATITPTAAQIETATATSATVSAAVVTPTVTPTSSVEPESADSAPEEAEAGAAGSSLAPESAQDASASARSGDVAVQGARAQTTTANAQTAGAVGGPGEGEMAVRNEHAVTLRDGGIAEGRTGVANADNTPAEDAPPVNRHGSSLAAASSGDATATGLDTQNSVSHQANVAVVVGGRNEGSVEVLSRNEVVVENRGQASATSGSSLAIDRPNGPAAKPEATEGSALTVSTPTPGATAVAGRSSAVSSTGLVADNAVQNRLDTMLEARGASASAIDVSHSQSVTMKNDGQAEARSADACGGAVCAPTLVQGAPTAASSPSGQAAQSGEQLVVEAASGAATARGLVAQNTVNTTADVGVRVAGENKGIIRIIIESVTRILNIGEASASSGQAEATIGESSAASLAGDSTGAPGQATSGDVSATGAQVVNRVDLDSTATVRVSGDNYNPLSIVLEFFVDIFNYGHSSAQSGSAQTSGVPAAADDTAAGSHGGTLSATSGRAEGTGLQVQNNVDLQGKVQVEIDGSNYGPIDILVRFITGIHNEGSSNVASADATASDAPSAAAVSDSNESASPSTSSATISNASGAASSVEAALTSTRSAASADTSAVLGQPSNGGSAQAISGSGTAIGLESTFVGANAQFSGVAGAKDAERSATNAASYLIETSGSASMSVGMAVAGPTPVPTPASTSAPTTTNRREDDHEPRRIEETLPDEEEEAEVAALASEPAERLTSTYAQVSPWGTEWPELTAPPLPPQRFDASRATVDPWSDLPELEQPLLPEETVMDEAESSGGAAVHRLATAPTAGQPVGSVDPGLTEASQAAMEESSPVEAPAANASRPETATQDASTASLSADVTVPPAGGFSSVLSTTGSILALALGALVAVATGWRRQVWVRAMVQRGVDRLLMLL